MADFKPMVAQAVVKGLLREVLGAEVRGLRLLKGGELSQAFGFAADGRELVVRFNQTATGFARDRYAWEHFASPELPIPRVVASGDAEGLAYAISDFVPGGHLHTRAPGDYLRLLPLALDALDALHRVDPGAADGFGYWREPGRGMQPTWRRFLEAVNEEEAEGFFAGWHRLFTESFLERDLFETTYRRMLELAEYCPEERRILHGDFGFDNVLSDGERITGVIDWHTLSYGDFVYDLAQTAFFSTNPAVSRLLHERYAATTPHFAERLACYQLWSGLGGLKFYTLAGNRVVYDWTKGRIATIEAG